MNLRDVHSLADLLRLLVSLGDTGATRTMLDNLRCDDAHKWSNAELLAHAKEHLACYGVE